MYHLNLQGKKSAKRETSHLLARWFLAQLICNPKDGGDTFL
jgi:hypothetical protein